MALNEYAVCGNTAYLFLRLKARGELLVCMLDTADLDRVLSVSRAWVPKWNPTAQTFYARVNKQGASRGFYMHRFILGVTDPLVPVDHADHMGLNNRRFNLSPVTRSQNGLNRHGPDRDRIYKLPRNVYYNKKDNYFFVSRQRGCVAQYLDSFATAEAAIQAAKDWQ